MFWYWVIGAVFAGVYIYWEYVQAKQELVIEAEIICLALILFVFGGAFALAACIFGAAILIVQLLDFIPPVRIVIKKTEK